MLKYLFYLLTQDANAELFVKSRKEILILIAIKNTVKVDISAEITVSIPALLKVIQDNHSPL